MHSWGVVSSASVNFNKWLTDAHLLILLFRGSIIAVFEPCPPPHLINLDDSSSLAIFHTLENGIRDMVYMERECPRSFESTSDGRLRGEEARDILKRCRKGSIQFGRKVNEEGWESGQWACVWVVH